MRPIIIFITLCLIRNSIQKVEFYETETTTKKQIFCVQTAFRKYLTDHSSVLIFSANPNNIVNSLPRLPHFVATHFDSVRKISSIHSGAVIVFLEGNAAQDFSDLKRLLNFVTVQPVLLVCITDAVCSSKMYMNKIVKMVNGEQLHYVAVDDGGIINIYEYTTTAEEDCGMAQFMRRGYCSDKSTVKKVFETSVNFHECPISVVTRFYPPYSEPCSLDELNVLCGVEGYVLRSVVKKLNATPVLATVQTFTDVKYLVAHRYADFGFGKLYTEPHDGISYSSAYFFFQATIAASHSMWAFEGSVRDIVLPLKLEVWAGIGMVIVFIFILRISIPYFRKIYILQLFGMIFGIAVRRQPRQLPNRIFFFSVVIFGYLCSQSYMANLMKVLSAPRQPMINTLDDLEKSNLRVTGSFSEREFFKNEYPRIYRDFQIDDSLGHYARLQELQTSHSSSVYYLETLDASIAKWKGVKRIEDEIIWYPGSMVVPNSSALLKTTNKVLASIMESGILHEYLSLSANRNQNRFSRHSDSTSLDESKVFDIRELEGVFFLLIAGLSLSFLVFLIEIVTPFIKTELGKRLKRRGEIYPEWFRQRHVRGILLPRQTSRASRR